jgi:hypothetical protein
VRVCCCCDGVHGQGCMCCMCTSKPLVLGCCPVCCAAELIPLAEGAEGDVLQVVRHLGRAPAVWVVVDHWHRICHADQLPVQFVSSKHAPRAHAEIADSSARQGTSAVATQPDGSCGAITMSNVSPPVSLVKVPETFYTNNHGLASPVLGPEAATQCHLRSEAKADEDS